ncbi:hypothetical protein [Erythrobacter dokdonensis]|uniref:Lipoprotein n=1 Tax=Erythrobacter dokdonensis DSW-74 TaxID=1300349 RepID=A0A1A7BIJ7_9SPHN|nr:hypothetical protein [Erythrobacter dokdonensis]MEE4315439.1 hypothetical protein [Erythrobacter sp.]OBV11272.1 hypothetical protein I603_1680 [Erythrobacter dokdonensis DSW-74]
MKRAAILALALLVAACDEQAASPSGQGGEAAGEVLGGSISDEMIPLEQLRSEAPLLPRQAAAPDSAANEEASEEAAPEGEPSSEGAEAAPAAPAPEPATEG